MNSTTREESRVSSDQHVLISDADGLDHLDQPVAEVRFRRERGVKESKRMEVGAEHALTGAPVAPEKVPLRHAPV